MLLRACESESGVPRVIVTRPAAQAAAWVQALRDAGIDAVALPLIDIGPPPSIAAVQAAWATLPATSMVLFVSANASASFFAHRPAGAVWPAGTRAAAPGPGTAEALRQAGLDANAVVAPGADAERFDSEQLWSMLQQEDWRGRSVLVVRGEDGRDWLADRWGAAGATVNFVAAYARQAPTPEGLATQILDQAGRLPQTHLWLFSSSEAVRHLAALAPSLPGPSRALATHPRIAEAARAAGFGAVGTCAARLDDVVRAVRGQAGGARATPHA